MDNSLLEKKFAALGARAKVGEARNTNSRFARNQMSGNGVRLNVLEDNKGEFFDIRINAEAVKEVSVLDVQPEDRHLLLFVRNQQGDKSKFLCGHDERHWFVAAIPETAPVGTVRQAKEALKPKEVQSRQVGLNAKKRNRRKNSAYIRQGEWFFIPEAIDPNTDMILKNEPITRGTGSKPHMCEYMYRSRGESVMVCGRYPNGVSMDQYNKLIRTDKGAKGWGWRQMMKDAAVYVKGRISHADHATIVLNGWHRVVMNTENKAAAMRQVAFLD
jgi:hypothetical protein